MALAPAEILDRWPALAPLVAQDDPPWRFFQVDSGQLAGERATASHVEALYIADVRHVSVVRNPVGHWSGSAVPEFEFTGPIHQAVAAILAPPVSGCFR